MQAVRHAPTPTARERQSSSNLWLGLGILLLVLALSIYLPFAHEGGGSRAAPFWGLIAVANLSFLVWGRFRTASLLSLIGAMMNATVIMANGGYMPVVGMAEPMGAWKPADSSSNLLFLADRMVVGGFSPGDFVLAAALLVLASRAILPVVRATLSLAPRLLALARPA